MSLVQEYLVSRKNELIDQINKHNNQIKKLKYEDIQCKRKMEEIENHTDEGKNIFSVDKSDKIFRQSELLHLEQRMNQIKGEIGLIEIKVNNLQYEKDCVEQCINDSKNISNSQDSTSSEFLLQEQYQDELANKLKENTIQKTTAALLKVELCQQIMKLDYNRADMELNAIYELLHDVIGNMKEYIYHVQPAKFDLENIDISILKLIEQINYDNRVRINYGINGKKYIVDEYVGKVMYRTLQNEISRIFLQSEVTDYVDVLLQYTQNGLQCILKQVIKKNVLGQKSVKDNLKENKLQNEILKINGIFDVNVTEDKIVITICIPN